MENMENEIIKESNNNIQNVDLNPKGKETKEERTNRIAAIKAKYGKIYSISTELIEDDSNSKEVEYIFKKPNTASYDRYVKTASKGMTKALQAFLLDNVIAEYEEQLTNDIEEYPALTLGIGQKLLAILGLSDNVNLMRP